jgi:hypothetical protein
VIHSWSIWSSDVGRRIMIALAIAISARVVVFVLAYYAPFTNEMGMSISPSSIQPWIEFEFYKQSLALYRDSSLGELIGLFTQFYQAPLREQFGHIIGGPVFPFFIAIFDYREGNTLPLASLFLVLSIVHVGAWIAWGGRRGFGLLPLVGLALLPNPFWFMLNLTTDLLFAVLVMAFYFAYQKQKWLTSDILIWSTTLVLAVLTRPNGGALLFFVFLDFVLLRAERSPQSRLIVLLATGTVGLAAAAYLYPYLVTEMVLVWKFQFFGITVSEYLGGLFTTLPNLIDTGLSVLSLLGAKLLYFVGLRPSFAGIPLGWLMLRAAAGLIALPGLFRILWSGSGRDRLFLLVFMLPIFLGPTQDRYNLPVLPLLFFHGYLVYASLWSRVSGRHGSSGTEGAVR